MYPACCGFYSKFFIYKQTRLSQLFIVLLALILTFMSLLLTYHSLVYTSVPACALELGPCKPWPSALARSRGSCQQSVNGRRDWRAADGQLTHRQSLACRWGCQRDRPPATVLDAGPMAPWPGWGLWQGEEERVSKGRRRKEERADGIPFEGLFLPPCGMPAGPLTRAQQNRLESSAGGYTSPLQNCQSPSPFSCPARALVVCIRNERRAVCFSALFFFFFFFFLSSDW